MDLILWRHAEAEDGANDLARELTQKGHKQAARVADYTAFFYMGELVEYDRTSVLFTKPSDPKTEDYITGRFG